MIKKNTLALLYFTFFLSQLSHAEYLIYKEDEWTKGIITLSDYEHEQVYNILLRNQWPTCLLFDKDNDSVMYSRLRKESDANKTEYERIKSQILGINKRLCVVYVPTILYELFAIYSNAVYGLGHEISELTLNQLQQGEAAHGTSPQARKNCIRTLLLDPQVRATHRIINNTFLEFLTGTPYYQYNCGFLSNRNQGNRLRSKKYLMPFSLFLDRFALQCINQLLVLLTKTEHASSSESNQENIFAKLVPLLQYPKVVRRLIELERKAQKQEKALVYHSMANCADFAFGHVRVRPIDISPALTHLPAPLRATRLKECLLNRYFELDKKIRYAKKRGDELDDMDCIELNTLGKTNKKDRLDEDLRVGKVSKVSNSSTTFLANFFDKATIYADLMLPDNPDNDLTAGMVLFLDKKQHTNDKALQNIFPVAPLNTLLGLFLKKDTVARMAAELQPDAVGIQHPQKQQSPDAIFEQAISYAQFVSTHGNIYILKVPNDEESVINPAEQEQQAHQAPPPYELQENLSITGSTTTQGTPMHNEVACLDVQNAGGFCPEPQTVAKYMHSQKTFLAVLKLLSLRAFRHQRQAMAQMRAEAQADIEEAEIQP